MAVTYRFRFDECLSPTLVAFAHSRGFEATHVLFLNRSGDADRLLTSYAVERDYVFVTNNRADFLRLYLREELHCGLVIFLPNVDKVEQQRLFTSFALALPSLGDLTNKRVEIDLGGNIDVLTWPPVGANDPDP